MTVLLSLVFVATVLILLALLFLYAEVRGIRKGIDEWLGGPTPRWPDRHTTRFGHHHRGPNPGYFVVWVWRDGAWHPILDDLPPGADPGSPPNHPGAMSGYHAKTWVSEKQA